MTFVHNLGHILSTCQSVGFESPIQFNTCSFNLKIELKKQKQHPILVRIRTARFHIAT